MFVLFYFEYEIGKMNVYFAAERHSTVNKNFYPVNEFEIFWNTETKPRINMIRNVGNVAKRNLELWVSRLRTNFLKFILL